MVRIQAAGTLAERHPFPNCILLSYIYNLFCFYINTTNNRNVCEADWQPNTEPTTFVRSGLAHCTGSSRLPGGMGLIFSVPELQGFLATQTAKMRHLVSFLQEPWRSPYGRGTFFRHFF